MEDDPGVAGKRFYIVYIGKVAGKRKYSLIDEEDAPMVENFRFEARADLDKNGNGAKIFAFAYSYDRAKDRHKGHYVHNYIWERRCGGIAPGFEVRHKNGITVDNRLQNLELEPIPSVSGWSNTRIWSSEKCQGAESVEDTLYWKTLKTMLAQNVQEESLYPSTKIYDANGNLLEQEYSTSCFYECHYLPCCRVEKELNEFRICSHCQTARYCGTTCQQGDWPSHKLTCKTRRKKRLKSVDRGPDR